jgi:hypothetical protein
MTIKKVTRLGILNHSGSRHLRLAKSQVTQRQLKSDKKTFFKLSQTFHRTPYVRKSETTMKSPRETKKTQSFDPVAQGHDRLHLQASSPNWKT